MFCNKCNHTLPDDSKFCQYCGNRLEITDETDMSDMPDFKNMLSEETLEFVSKSYVEQTLNATKTNSQAQPNKEGDADFGLIPEKPIYTFAVKSVDGEEEYLNKLYTENGKKVKWNRRGSVGIDGVHGMIDIYDTYLPTGQFYKTIYINMYGARTSTIAPKGFVLSSIGTSSPKSISTIQKNSTQKNNSDPSISITSVILSVIAILSIIVALNIQDVARNIYEPTSPTLLYLILLVLYAIFAVICLFFKKQTFFVAQCIFSLVPSIFTIFTFIEGSLFSISVAGSLEDYINGDLVNIINIPWVLMSFTILIINFPSLITIVQTTWHSSIRYRESRYKRVIKMKEYLDNGIISEEEFEKNKKEILKHINF